MYKLTIKIINEHVNEFNGKCDNKKECEISRSMTDEMVQDSRKYLDGSIVLIDALDRTLRSLHQEIPAIAQELQLPIPQIFIDSCTKCTRSYVDASSSHDILNEKET
jgi:hypothetical protein